jgi:hypothetical protein
MSVGRTLRSPSGTRRRRPPPVIETASTRQHPADEATAAPPHHPRSRVMQHRRRLRPAPESVSTAQPVGWIFSHSGPNRAPVLGFQTTRSRAHRSCWQAAESPFRSLLAWIVVIGARLRRVGRWRAGGCRHKRATLVERHSCYVVLIELPNCHGAVSARKAMAKKILTLPIAMRVTARHIWDGYLGRAWFGFVDGQA